MCLPDNQLGACAARGAQLRMHMLRRQRGFATLHGARYTGMPGMPLPKGLGLHPAVCKCHVAVSWYESNKCWGRYLSSYAAAGSSASYMQPLCRWKVNSAPGKCTLHFLIMVSAVSPAMFVVSQSMCNKADSVTRHDQLSVRGECGN